METHPNLLETLTEEQQLQVYELMGVSNIEDGNTAARLYIEANYDLNRALQKFLDGQLNPSSQNMSTPGDNYSQQFQPPRNDRPQRNQETELHKQYRQHIKRKNTSEDEKGITDSLKGGVNNVMSGFKSMWNSYVPISIRGETPGGEQFIEYFKKHFGDTASRLILHPGTFEENAFQAHKDNKPLLIYVHIDKADYKQIPKNLFKTPTLASFIEKNFYLLGILVNTEEAQKVLRHVELKHCPCLAVFRTNLLDEIVLVEFKSLTSDDLPDQILEQLKAIQSNYNLIETEEKKIKNDVQKSLRGPVRREQPANPAFFPIDDENLAGPLFPFLGIQPQPQRPQIRPEEQQRIDEARILRHIQDEEYKEVERKILEQQIKQAEDEKSKQNKSVQEEEKRRQAEEEERKREEEKESVKLAILERLPLEPAEGEADIILIIFRLTDGKRIERRFRNSDKTLSLYDYIDLQDIPFDSTTVRYDLMQPRPYLCLDDKEKAIGEYFEGSDSEVIHVRELTS